MAQNQQVQLKIKGLYTSPNDFSGVPEGALEVADDCVIDNDNLIEPRRGFDFITQSLGLTSERIDKWVNYQGFKIVHFGTNQMAYYNSGWTQYSGTYEFPDAVLAKCRFVEAQQNLYISTSLGIKKLDTYSAAIGSAGIPKGLDLQLVLTGASGYMSTNNALTTTGNTSTSTTLAVLGSVASIAVGQYVFGSGVTSGTTVSSITTSATVLTTTCTTAAGSTTISILAVVTGIVAGQIVTGTGIISGTRVVSVNAGAFTAVLSLAPFTTGATSAISFSSDPTVIISTATSSTLTGTSLVFSNGAQVAYRGLWGFKDANNNLLYGTPSQYASITNTNGTTTNVQFTMSIPAGITTNHFFQIYRSAQTAGSTITPIDDMQLVYEGNPSAGDLSNGYVQVTDSTPDSLRGAYLYTGTSQQGILQANEPPPFCKDFCSFKNFGIFGNVKSKQRKKLTLLSALTLANNDTLVIAGITFTAVNGYTFTVTAANATVGATYTNNGNTFTVLTTIAGGTTLSCSGTGAVTASGTLTKASGSGDATITFSVAANRENVTTGKFYIASTGTPAQNITDTVNSLIKCINRYASSTQSYAYLISGPTDLPGQILLEERVIGGAAFALTYSGTGSSWSPSLPVSGVTISSAQDVFKNGIMVSKSGQFESVPTVNLFYAGSASKEILRVIPLREYVVILKEDGIFRLTGSTLATMAVAPFDYTTKLIAPDSAVSLSNEVWGFFDQGVCSISDTGVNVRSRPIETTLRALVGSALTAIKTYSFAVGYETDRKYILALPSTSGDTYCTQEYVFNNFTTAWTRWTRAAYSGFIDPSEDKLYFGNGAANTAAFERKTFTYSDYADEGFSVTISSAVTYSVTLASSVGITAGDVLYQSASVFSQITAVDLVSGIVTVQDNVVWTPGVVTVYPAFSSVVQWKPAVAGNPAYVRQYSEGCAIFKRTRFVSAGIAFFSDVSQAFESVTLLGFTLSRWGTFPWGSNPWGGTNRARSLRFLVPQNKQMASQLGVKLTIRSSFANWACEGVSVSFNPVNQEIAS